MIAIVNEEVIPEPLVEDNWLSQWFLERATDRLAQMSCDAFTIGSCSDHELCVTDFCAVCAAKELQSLRV